MRIFQVSVDDTTVAFLRAKGFSVATGDVSGPEDLEEFLDYGAYEAFLIDLDRSSWGQFAIRYFRSRGIRTPFVCVTAGDGETSWAEQRSLFLENGGDDLLRSPANPRELAATLRACARRNTGLVVDIREFRSGEALVRINLSLQTVSVNGVLMHLTGKERLLIALLASSKGRILSKEMLLSGLYSVEDDEAEIKIIDVFVCKLRRKLHELHPDAGRVIETVWGRGYQMVGSISEPEPVIKVA